MMASIGSAQNTSHDPRLTYDIDMKHTKHENRKSFRKWAMLGQRIETEDMTRLNKRRAKSKFPWNVGR